MPLPAPAAPTPAGFHMTVSRWLAVVPAVALLLALGRVVCDVCYCDATPAARRAQCVNNMKQILLALHNYESVHGCFPPAYVVGPDGKPWHSWRVLILPYLDESPTYGRYRFDEPWNGPNNITLLKTIPPVYVCPSPDDGWGSRPSPTRTSYLAFTGPGTGFPGARPSRLDGFRDGFGKTVLIAEFTDASVPWTAPRDLDVSNLSFRVNDPKRPGPSSRHPGGANLGHADGSIRFRKNSEPPAGLKALVTIDGKDNPAGPD